MLLFDFKAIGNKLLLIRKSTGLTQSEIAEAAELSDRTYADIERGAVNMRIETVLKICKALHITPDEILTESTYSLDEQETEIIEQLKHCSNHERKTALMLLSVYLQSLR